MTQVVDTLETMEPKSRKHKVDVRLAVMDMTAKDLSALWGCTPQQFLYWARSDHRDVKAETLERLAEMLGVPIGFLSDANWDGLFAPEPEWLTDAKNAAKKPGAKGTMEKIASAMSKQ